MADRDTKDEATPLGTEQPTEEFYPEEEVTEGNWARPQVEVHEIKVETGEEEEECFWKCRSKLYRWAVAAEGQGGEWKERGLGESKLLRHKVSKKIRFLLRQEKTLKIVANHYVLTTDVYCSLTPNVGSDKIYVWTVMDFADGTLKNEQFALKFGQVEQALLFKAKFEEACELNAKAFGVDKKNDIASDGLDDGPCLKKPGSGELSGEKLTDADGRTVVKKSNEDDITTKGS